ncbi:nucleoside 2-deoxyribosyltransferase domain-containing protein [Kitasatospora sp. NPDC048407]|uniref:nucleoside 2-deoxyribosyltransferase domain-containing protein n=1 Tax=Kitasatospora sp. NPDC048407 TaxID=3364051 RepID=UPI0037223444
MINVVMAREPFPTVPGPSVFLAGPTPDRGGPGESWRPAAIAELDRQWRGQDTTLTVFSPESRGGIRAERYTDQTRWERAARARASVVMFWIPRDLATMPGFTTNVEFGYDIAKRRIVLGCPPDCPNPERNRYLIDLAHEDGAPVRDTLPGTVAAALEFARPADRLFIDYMVAFEASVLHTSSCPACGDDQPCEEGETTWALFVALQDRWNSAQNRH